MPDGLFHHSADEPGHERSASFGRHVEQSPQGIGCVAGPMVPAGIRAMNAAPSTRASISSAQSWPANFASEIAARGTSISTGKPPLGPERPLELA
jgi:hypothetical protein